MYKLAQHIEQYDYLLKEEKILKTPTRGRIYKNPTVGYTSAGSYKYQYVSIDVAEIVIDKPCVCKALAYASSKDIKTYSANVEAAVKTSKIYTFDITKADVIFDQLLLARSLSFSQGMTFLRPKI
ncbi:hypothetical protein COP1_047096 [Malus domestica]